MQEGLWNCLSSFSTHMFLYSGPVAYTQATVRMLLLDMKIGGPPL
jgi:hypothetical protein